MMKATAFSLDDVVVNADEEIVAKQAVFPECRCIRSRGICK